MQTGMLEGSLFLKTGKMVPMSEQELVDCGEDVQTFGDWCGAEFDIVRLGGIESAATYPYEGGKKNQCRFDKSKIVAIAKQAWHGYCECAFPMPHSVMKWLTQKGPLANIMSAHPRTFQFYSKGAYHLEIVGIV